jgi:hypothetical protein
MTETKTQLKAAVRVTAALVAASLLAIAGDANGASRSAREGNTVPVISGSPAASVSAGQTYLFTPTVTDDDGPRLQFRIRGKPAWAVFDPSTGSLSGRPTRADIGTYANISISADDGIERASLPTFAIAVVAPAPLIANAAPTITGAPATEAVTGQLYAFAPTAYDNDGDTLTFSATNVPAWAYLDNRTGRLYGTPGEAAVGTYANIQLSVTDGKDSASLPAFSIAVIAPANVAPTIGGTPPDTAHVGQTYAFRPTAGDADGDTLTFAIQNKPAWATFDTRSGAVGGTPSAGDVGSYADVRVSVSDGELVARLPAFAITVLQDGSVSISWEPPATNTDGTPTDALKGYKVFYGIASRQYTSSVPVMNPDITSATIEQLAPATWFFAVKAVNIDGVESDYSTEVSKNVQ